MQTQQLTFASIADAKKEELYLLFGSKGIYDYLLGVGLGARHILDPGY
jgi:hypothetical protein